LSGLQRKAPSEGATAPDPTPPARRSWGFTALALLVFLAADAVLFRALWGRDLTEGALMPPLSLYEELARGEAEPQPAVFWDGVATNDLRFVIWLVARNARTLLFRPTALFDAEPCYPARNSLALGEPGISQGVVAMPAYLLTRDPIATYALLLIALPLISALAMFLLVRDWTGQPVAGITAGLLYGFHAIKTWEVVHPYVWDTSWTVLALWLSVRLFEKARWRDALGLAACVSLQIAGSFYALLAASVIGMPFLAWLVWRYGLRRALLPRLALSAALVLLVAWVVMTPYLELRSAGVLEVRADQHFLKLDWLLPGGFLFLGWVLVALALLGLASRRVRDLHLSGNPRFVLVLSGGLLFVLSAGGSIDPELGRPAPLLPGYGWLASFLPGLDVIRSPASLYSGTHLTSSLLAGLGAAAVLRRIPSRFVAVASLGLILAASGTVSFHRSSSGLDTSDFRFVSVRPAAEAIRFFETLERLGNEGPLLEVPVPYDVVIPRVSTSVLLSAYHGRPTSDCYNSFIPPELEDARRAADALPSEKGVRVARDLGFTTIVLHHPPGYPSVRRRHFERYALQHPGGPLTPLHASESMSAYAIEPEGNAPEARPRTVRPRAER
jgi:hypothetical protein